MRRLWLLAALCGLSVSARADFTVDVLKSFRAPEAGPTPLVRGGDGAIYGATFSGGTSGMGTVFRIDASGTFTRVHSFSGADGRNPVAPLVVGTGGMLYGLTILGGASGRGTVFRLDASGHLDSLHSFSGGDGSSSSATLVSAPDGAVYGTTYDGGPANCGTIFKIDGSGSYEPVYAFPGSLCARPFRPLTVGSDGALYGAGNGSIFRLEGSRVTELRAGIFPVSALALGGDGKLYGADAGSVWRIDAAGHFEPLGACSTQSLVTGSDGAVYGMCESQTQVAVIRIDAAGQLATLRSSSWNPFQLAPLALGTDGALYGRYFGAADEERQGVVFRIDPAGSVSVIRSFGLGESFASDYALTMGGDGALYGVDSLTVARLTLAGQLTSLHEFYRGEDGEGASPTTGLVAGPDGAFYGVTTRGGASGKGTVFRIGPAGGFTSLHSFDGHDGAWPEKSLVVGADAAMYGVSNAGGVAGDPFGAVFRVATDGSFSILHGFEAFAGNPQSPLVVGSDRALYGTTGPSLEGAGTVFRVDAAGDFESLHSFTGTSDSNGLPLAVGSDGALYGTRSDPYSPTSSVFRVTPANEFSEAFFEPGDGQAATPLVAGGDGALYGLTTHTGVYRVAPGGLVTRVHSFKPGGSTGFSGNGLQGTYSLTPVGHGVLFGTIPFTAWALPMKTTIGAPALGFSVEGGSVTAEGLPNDVASLADRDLRVPLVVGCDGGLYGTVYASGSGYGAIFRIDRAGNSRIVYEFATDASGSAGKTGGYPRGALVLGSDCALYGTAEIGGAAGGGGVVFRVRETDRPPEPQRQPQEIVLYPLYDWALGTPPVDLAQAVWASSRLPVELRAEGSCSVSGTRVTLDKIGFCTLIASQAGDSTWAPASDVAGSFRVLFDFDGFLGAVVEPPRVNRVKAGRRVTLRFELGGDQGSDVLLRAPHVRDVPCDSTVRTKRIAGSPFGRQSAFVHTAKSRRYAYLWKTDKAWAGTCKELSLDLVDGSTHSILFRFDGKRPTH